MDASGERPKSVTGPQKGPLNAARDSAAHEHNDKPEARQGQAVDVWAHEPHLSEVTEAAVDPKYNLILEQCRAHLPHELYVYVRDNIQAEFKNSSRDTPDEINKSTHEDLLREGVSSKLALLVSSACNPDDLPRPSYLMTENQFAYYRKQAHQLPETTDDVINNQDDKVSTMGPPSVTGTLYKVARHSWQAAQQGWWAWVDKVNDKVKDE